MLVVNNQYKQNLNTFLLILIELTGPLYYYQVQSCHFRRGGRYNYQPG